MAGARQNDSLFHNTTVAALFTALLQGSTCKDMTKLKGLLYLCYKWKVKFATSNLFAKASETAKMPFKKCKQFYPANHLSTAALHFHLSGASWKQGSTATLSPQATAALLPLWAHPAEVSPRAQAQAPLHIPNAQCLPNPTLLCLCSHSLQEWHEAGLCRVCTALGTKKSLSHAESLPPHPKARLSLKMLLNTRGLSMLPSQWLHYNR